MSAGSCAGDEQRIEAGCASYLLPPWLVSHEIARAIGRSTDEHPWSGCKARKRRRRRVAGERWRERDRWHFVHPPTAASPSRRSSSTRRRRVAASPATSPREGPAENECRGRSADGLFLRPHPTAPASASISSRKRMAGDAAAAAWKSARRAASLSPAHFETSVPVGGTRLLQRFRSTATERCPTLARSRTDRAMTTHASRAVPALPQMRVLPLASAAARTSCVFPLRTEAAGGRVQKVAAVHKKGTLDLRARRTV